MSNHLNGDPKQNHWYRSDKSDDDDDDDDDQ